MKALYELFEEIDKFYESSLYLLDYNNDIIVSINTKEQGIIDTNKKKYIAIKTHRGEIYYLYGENLQDTEKVGMIKLLIEGALNKAKPWDINYIAQQLMMGTNDENILKHIKRLHLKDISNYHVLAIEYKEKDEQDNLYTIIKNCFKDKKNIICARMDQTIALLLDGKYDRKEISNIAFLIRDTIMAELYIDIYIGLSNTVHKLQNIHQALKAAKEAIDIGKKIYNRGKIFFYSDLQLEKIVLGITKEHRQNIYMELFHHQGYDKIDGELYNTVEAFMENSLHLGDTAKILFIHRNTLAYRLDKIYKLTNLDVRKFDDAIRFKLGWMLRKSL